MASVGIRFLERLVQQFVRGPIVLKISVFYSVCELSATGLKATFILGVHGKRKWQQAKGSVNKCCALKVSVTVAVWCTTYMLILSAFGILTDLLLYHTVGMWG